MNHGQARCVSRIRFVGDLVGQELQEMLEKHRAQNEAWLRARAEENDKERKELCKLRVRKP